MTSTTRFRSCRAAALMAAFMAACADDGSPRVGEVAGEQNDLSGDTAEHEFDERPGAQDEVADVPSDRTVDTPPDDFSTTWALEDFSRVAGLFTAPFPDISITPGASGYLLEAYPASGEGIAFVDTLIALASRRDGFGQSSPLYLPFNGTIETSSLPADALDSLSEDAAVFLVGVEPGTTTFGQRYPIDVSLRQDGASTLLVAIPHPGVPLPPRALVALVATTQLTGGDGRFVRPSDAVRRAVDAEAGRSDTDLARRPTVDALTELGVQPEAIAGLAIFRTGDATEELFRAAAGVREAINFDGAPTLDTRFDNFCVYHTTAFVPVYQAGTPPFDGAGGGWIWSGDSTLALQRTEVANVWISIPRTPPDHRPALDTVVFVRTGGGGDRPLIDRGLRAVAHGGTTPGTGPAVQLASVGWAGISVDGPHGGLRNISGRDEQLLIFNFQNPEAMRDNIRQSAVELAMLPAALDSLTFDARDCWDRETATPVTLGGHLALMGHSMGATIAPLAAAVQPRYEAIILSGAGGSWIENVIHKESPIPVRPLAELILRLSPGELRRDDPSLALLQWAGEVADPPLYAAHVTAGANPRHVLMFQGITDTYIFPPVANALSLSLGLDLGGSARERTDARLDRFATLPDLLPLSGRRQRELPLSGNLEAATGAITGVIVQHVQDAIEDGHEVMFQVEAPKVQYMEFLKTLASGETPAVVSGGL